MPLPEVRGRVRWTIFAEMAESKSALGAALCCIVLAFGFVNNFMVPTNTAIGSLSWWMESLWGFGPVRMGIPGLFVLLVYLNPLIEVMPRIWREKDVRKLPLLPYSAMAANCVLWTTYGLLGGLPAVWAPNACGLGLALYYCWVYCNFCPKAADWLPFTRGAHLVTLLVATAACAGVAMLLPRATAMRAVGLVGCVSGVVMGAGPLVAIRQVLEEQSTRSLPFGFTCVITVNCALWSCYGLGVLGDPMIYVPNIAGLPSCLFQLALFARFGVYREPPAECSLDASVVGKLTAVEEDELQKEDPTLAALVS